ncbi:MAG TPA: hypothetical protein VFC13_22815, partial [Actinomycetes bacterium]|nr:hypothetical protein [Actinomycetes bacterium]
MKLPYAAVEFTTDGQPNPDQVTAAVAAARSAQATDVLLIAHGWNNDIDGATRMFERLTDNLADQLAAAPAGRRVAVTGVLWPSIRWADEDEVAGGGASAGDAERRLHDNVDEAVEDPAVASELHAAADRLAADPDDGRAAFLAALRRLLPDPDPSSEDPVPGPLADGDPDTVFAAAEEALAGLEEDEEAVVGEPDEGPPGSFPDLLADDDVGGAGLLDIIRNPVEVGRNLLNLTTYYTMKDRAGKVGSRGLTQLQARLREGVPGVRLHLAGHSFGARVVSAAAAAAATPVHSVSLLQGAFSHFGFAHDYARSGKDGLFRPAVTGQALVGPIIVTHTHKDSAVRTAYAIASRLARQIGADLGGGP